MLARIPLAGSGNSRPKKEGRNMIKIGHQVYSNEEILEFVEKNKNSLLQTKNGGVIAAIQDGMCLVVSKAGRIYKAWPGEVELQW
jgi:hypothetical protein